MFGFAKTAAIAAAEKLGREYLNKVAAGDVEIEALMERNIELQKSMAAIVMGLADSDDAEMKKRLLRISIDADERKFAAIEAALAA